MLSLVNDAKHRHCDQRGGCPQSLWRARGNLNSTAPSEPVWLRFGIIICFIKYGCATLCIDMFRSSNQTRSRAPEDLNNRCNLTIKKVSHNRTCCSSFSHKPIGKKSRGHGISEVVSLKDLFEFFFFFLVKGQVQL